MKIAYVTTYDSADIRGFSGLGYYIRETLQHSGFEITCIDNLRDTLVLFKPKRLIYRVLLSQGYHRDREPLLLRSYAKQVSDALIRTKVDIIFSPGTLPIAYLDTSIPVVFWADATFAGMVNFYPGYYNLCRETLRDGNRMEQLALSRCRLAIYSSDWAAQSAIKNYDVDPEKVKVVPFGANLDVTHNGKDVEDFVKARSASKCKLLFLGMDWIRKGGDFALKVAEMLNSHGLETELHVVGCNPPGMMPEYVKIHGFISKKTQAGRERLNQLLTDSHFLILPSKAECLGVAFAEASAFGLPSLATDVGGIATVIRNGVNGQTFSLKGDPGEYCEFIMRVLSRKEDYEQLALSSYREYCGRLNWVTAGSEVHRLILDRCYQ